MANKGEHILAVDLGTSGPKVALVSMRGEVVDWTFEPNQLILLPGGGAEQDPDDWWRAIVRATQRLWQQGQVAADSVRAVCCTTQWSGTVPVDAAGRHLHNAVIWMDTRGASDAARLTGGAIKVAGLSVAKAWRWVRLTAGAPSQSGKDPIAHILWLMREHPEIHERTFMYLEPKDYLNLRLTGQFAASYDSIALHWVTDNRRLDQVDYDDKLLRISGVSRDQLPSLKRAVDILGPISASAAAELGIPATAQVVMGTPDVQSAALGSGAVADFDAHLYIGTSSWLTCHVPFKKTDVLNSMCSLPSAIPDRYLVANEQEVAGKAVGFMLHTVLFPDDALGTGPVPEAVYEGLEALVASAPAGSGKVIFTPWLYGERTPIDDHTVRGGFFNLSLSTTRAHMMRAVLEGVAYNACWLRGYLEKFIKRPLSSIAMIGGGAQSPTWCQIQADVHGCEIRQVAHPILANVRGAGLLGAVALGEMAFSDIAARVEIANTYSPKPENRAIYDELFGAFVEIYKRNRKLYARLNRQA